MLPKKVTIPKKSLIKGAVYTLYHDYKLDGKAVFSHIGQTGMPIFHPLGEPSFQDVFALKFYNKRWTAIYDRMATQEELGI